MKLFRLQIESRWVIIEDFFLLNQWSKIMMNIIQIKTKQLNSVWSHWLHVSGIIRHTQKPVTSNSEILFNIFATGQFVFPFHFVHCCLKQFVIIVWLSINIIRRLCNCYTSKKKMSMCMIYEACVIVDQGLAS